MMDPEDVHTSLLDFETRINVLEIAAKQPAGLDGMTLAQLEAMAERLGAAARTIRDAQALLGGPLRVQNATVPENLDGSVGQIVHAPDPISLHRMRQFQAPEMPSGSKLKLSPAEQADRARALGQFANRVVDPDLPDDIAALERE